MSKKLRNSLITWSIIIVIIVVAVILLVTVVNKKTVTPIFQTDSTGETLIAYNGKEKKVVVPKKIKVIGVRAFQNNSQVSEVTFESGSKLEIIAREAFSECVNLEKIILPSSLKQIDFGAFEQCMRLTEVNLPSSVKSIGEKAFYECSNVKNISLNEGLESIGNNAFFLTGITTITIPSTVKSFGENVFDGCDELEEIKIASGNTLLSFDDNSDALYMNNSKGRELILVLKTETHEFIIPSDVNKIHGSAFMSAENIHELNIPNSVEEIGLAAFKGCTFLKSIKLPFIGTKLGSNMNVASVFGVVPESLTTIEISQGVSVTEKAFKELTTITTVILPTTIKSIDQEAFSGCVKLSEIFNIPTNLTKISKNAFYDCSSLGDELFASLITPSVAVIEDGAFAGCNSLVNVVIPNTVMHIGQNAFANCNGIKSISLPFIGMGYETNVSTGELKKDSSNNYVFNTLTTFSYIFGSVKQGVSQVIPTSLTTVTIVGNYDIPANAFKECTKLTTINISDEVKNIGEYAFSGIQIKSINLPSKLVSLGQGAFMNCSSLLSIVIPNGVTTLEENTFAGCTALTTVDMSNVTKLEAKVFDKCSSLKTIIIDENNPSYKFVVTENSDGNSYVLFTSDLSELILFLKTSTVKSYTVPAEVKYIHMAAFVNCLSLQELIIPVTVEEISEQAIVSCGNLTKLAIPFVGNKKEADNPYFESILAGSKPYALEVELLSGTIIENEAFINVDYLVSIKLNSELEYIGNSAFYNCAYLETVEFDVNATNLTYIGKRAFFGCSEIKSLELPTSIKTIGDYAFAECNKIKSFSIPRSVEKIGTGAFRNWSSLITLNIDDDHPTYKLENGALLSKNGKDLVLYVAGDEKTSYVIAESVETIYPYAFSGANNLVTVVIPETITTLPEGLFYGCSKLETVTLPTSTTYISTSMFENCRSLVTINNIDNIVEINSHAFSGCSQLQTIPLSEKVTTIGESAFEGCQKLVTVVLPSTITHIAKSAFKECTNLMTVIMSEGVKEIGESAFEGCVELCNLVLPETLEEIGSRAFFGCRSNNFTRIIIPEAVTVIGAQAFAQCSYITYVYIPETVVTIGRDAFASQYFSKILSNAITSETTAEGTTIYTRPEGWNESFNSGTDSLSGNGEFAIIDGVIYSVEKIVEVVDQKTNITYYAKVVGYIGEIKEVNILEKVSINEVEYNVTTIARQAFAWAESLESVTIHSGITTVDTDIFNNCPNLTSIKCNVSSKPDGWNSNWNSGKDVTWN